MPDFRMRRSKCPWCLGLVTPGKQGQREHKVQCEAKAVLLSKLNRRRKAVAAQKRMIAKRDAQANG